MGENRRMLVETNHNSRSLRDSSFPSLKVPDSIFDGKASAFLDGESAVGSAEFDFDDDVVNSTVYRRNMTQRQTTARRKMQNPEDSELVDLGALTAEEEAEAAGGSGRIPDSRGTSRISSRTPNMEAPQEDDELQGSPHRSSRHHSAHTSTGSSTTRGTHPQASQLKTTHRADMNTPDTLISSNATLDTNSYRSPDASLRELATRSPHPTASDLSSNIVNFSRKTAMTEPSSVQGARSYRTDSLNEFYDDSSSNFVPTDDRESLQSSRQAPAAARRVEPYDSTARQRGAMPFKAARRLGVDDRAQPRLAHIEEDPIPPEQRRPASSTSTTTSGSSNRGKKPAIPQKSLSDLGKHEPFDWSQPCSVFWQLTPEDVRKPPHGYTLGLQELWWKLLQLEEAYQHSLEMLYTLISSDNMSLPTCGITPLAVRKIQLAHDKFLRQPLRLAMGVGPWNFEYPAIVKAYQTAHAHLVPLYERYSWDLPLVTFQVAASSAPASSASRDLLLSIGPGMPTRYTCLRSPLTHICATFDTIQALYDGMYKGGHSSPNFAQIITPVREQLRSLIASCNRNVLLRWDDLRRSNLFGTSASRDILVVTKELIFPPSQRRNIALLNLSSPTRAVISRADLHWKSKPKDSWSRCHAILLNNYLILASVSDAKGQRQHQVYHLVC